jgi:heme/copper-type cytochrome/quinol oxidase subunit 1
MWQLLLPHFEFVLLGWTLQLAMGVAFWILSRYLQGPEHGREAIAWLAFVLFNGGVLLVGVSWRLRAPALIPLLGRIAEAGSAVAFGVHAWRRVRPSGV